MTKIEGIIQQLQQEKESKDLDAKIKKIQIYRQDWVKEVMSLLLCGDYEKAEKEFYKVLLNENGEIITAWLDTDSAILAIMFKIHITERNNGENSVFELFSSLDEMKDLYFELKFILRRFEYNLPQKEELLLFMQQYPISPYVLSEMTDLCITQTEKVLNEVALFLFQKQYYEHVLPLLSTAYEKNSDNPHTLYNMSYVLYAYGENDMARHLIEKTANESWREKELYQIIKDGEDLPEYRENRIADEEFRMKVPVISKPKTLEKIAFIICVNNKRYYEECCYYINHLVIPDGYCVEVVPIYQAKSMTSGYQTGMNSTQAKYKIYMHQDVLCTNPYLLYEMIHIFEMNSNIGLIGVAGCVKMPVTGIWWDAKEGTYYNLYQDSIASYGFYNYRENEEDYNCKEYQEVQALDGVFLATSKDVDWREDLFESWHHYDVSQSMEFHRKGYQVVIPRPHKLWILHNEKCGGGLGNDYRESRIRFLQEYKEELE